MEETWDFPGSPVVKILCFHCREQGSISGQEELRSHMPHGTLKKKKKKKNHK